MVQIATTEVWISIEDKDHLYAERIDVEDLRDDDDIGEMDLDGWLEYNFPDGVSEVVKELHTDHRTSPTKWEPWLYGQCEAIMQGDNALSWMDDKCVVRCYHKCVMVRQ